MSITTVKPEKKERVPRLSVKKRKYVIAKMKDEIQSERQRAQRGTKRMINRLAATYRKKIYEALRDKSVSEKDMVSAILSIRDSFKTGLKSVEDRDKLALPPLRDEPVSDSAATGAVSAAEDTDMGCTTDNE